MSLHPKALAYLSGLPSQLPEFLASLKEVGQREKVPIVSDEVGQMLQLLCGLTRPKQVLELGSGIGYATHWMLLGWPSAQITAVDANPDRLQLAAQFLEESGAAQQVRLVNQWVENFLEAPPAGYDLIFLDSTKKDYPTLLEQCYKSLQTNGLLVADNIFYQGKLLRPVTHLSPKEQQNNAKMDQFNRQAAMHPGLETQFFAIGDGLMVARKLT